MSEEQAEDELGVDNLAGFRSALNQLNAAYEKEPFENLLPLLCLLYTSPSPRDRQKSRMPSSA